MHAQWLYTRLTIQYQGECGHIEGHAYSVLFVHNETCACLLGPRVSCIYEFNNSLMHPRKHQTANNMHADTLGAGPFVSPREVVLYT